MSRIPTPLSCKYHDTPNNLTSDRDVYISFTFDSSDVLDKIYNDLSLRRNSNNLSVLRFYGVSLTEATRLQRHVEQICMSANNRTISFTRRNHPLYSATFSVSEIVNVVFSQHISKFPADQLSDERVTFSLNSAS